MRKLRLFVRSSQGALPLLVSAIVLPESACGSRSGLLASSQTDQDAAAGGTGALATGGTGASGGTSSGGTGGNGGAILIDAGGGTGGVSGDAGTPFCPVYSITEEFTVELPDEGVPATPGAICSASVEPVPSHRAARLTLTGFENGGTTANGFIEIDPKLAADVVGKPKVTILDATLEPLFSLAVSGVVKVAGGFSLQASFGEPITVSPDSAGFSGGFARMTALIEFTVQCANAPSRVVHAAHDLHLCLDDAATDVEWVSSGDQCVVCRIIAEMAPSPIVPEASADELPLAGVLRLRLVELARVSNRVILLAEHDGGGDSHYEWHGSGGQVESLCDDVIAWTLQPGDSAPMMQVAVWNEHAAGVASFSWNASA